jgi:hypothetical protein
MANGKAGRPLKFKSVRALQKAINAYFESCFDYQHDAFGNRLVEKDENGHPITDDDGNKAYIMKQVKPFTITGLANALDTTRELLVRWEDGKYDDQDEDLTDEQRNHNEQIATFSNTIKRAKQICYEYTEEALFNRGSATGAIFSLKNNWDWNKDTIIGAEEPARRDLFENLTEEELITLSRRSKHGQA